ncbi:hypothetical protein ACWGOQ_0012690 [Aquimarina sp. M1]
MESEKIKHQYLAKLDKEVVAKLKEEHFLMLDETIENVIEGNDNVNGKKAETKDELFLVISFGMITRIESFKAMVSSILNAEPNSQVNINYRGKVFTYDN